MRRLVVFSAAVVLTVTGCSGGGSTSKDESPQDRLAAAKKSLDDAEYIGFTLSTDSLPDGVDGLLEATGTGTHAPAFTGDAKVKTAITVTTPIIAVDGKVYIQLPFSPWDDIDPAAYGAPDPAALMATDSGVSSLFTATTDVKVGDSERDADVVLTSISGVIPNAEVKALFPSSGDGDFDVTYTVTDDDDIDRAAVTGPFYEGSDDVTYDLDFDLNADAVDISAPD